MHGKRKMGSAFHMLCLCCSGSLTLPPPPDPTAARLCEIFYPFFYLFTDSSRLHIPMKKGRLINVFLMPSSHLACDEFTEPVRSPCGLRAEASVGRTISVRIHGRRSFYDFVQ